MAENTGTQMIAEEQAQRIAALKQEAARIGLDPNNPVHLEATEAALMEMQRLQVTQSDTEQDVAAKLQERRQVAQELKIDISGFEAQQKQTQADAEGLATKTKTRGIINLVLAAAAGIGAAFLTNKAGNDRGWGGWKWPANIGAFLAAGAGTTLLGSKFLMAPLQKKAEESMQALNTAAGEMDNRLYAAIAQHFAKEIEAEHAQKAAAEAAAATKKQHEQQQHAPAPAQNPPHHPAHGEKPHPHPDHAPQTGTGTDAQTKQEIAKEVHEGREATYPSGKQLDGAAPKGPMDRVAPPAGTHQNAAEHRKEVAATQQHTRVG